MWKRSAVLSLVLGACGAQEGLDPATTVTPLTLEPPPIYSLLGYRSDLDLTSEQIVRLDSLANWIREENAPLVDTLRSLRDGDDRDEVVFQVNEEGQAVLEAIRANNRRAGEAVGEVLTEEQRPMVCRLFDRGWRGAAPPPQGDSARREPDAPADTVATRSGRLWPWCAPPAAEADSTSAR